MKKILKSTLPYLPYVAIIIIGAYAFSYFNFLETPTADYIGNFRPPALEYLQGIFPGNFFKILPLYPLVLAFITKVVNSTGFDPVYTAAITFNFILFIPYLIIVYKVFSIFLTRPYAIIALLFLGVNGFTIFTAINAELEMLLSILIVGSLYLNFKKSNLKYVTAFFTAITKWDSVFIIPAVMYNDFFIEKKRIKTFILGTLSSVGLLFWTIRLLVMGLGSQNPYIGEISHRGPNIYRYVIDTFLVSSGFSQWMATDVYFAHIPMGVKVLLLLFIAVIIISIIAATITGIISLFRNHRDDALPLFIFYAGFVLIHIIYQNTKSRYVLPVLWLQYLIIFYGISTVIIPWLIKKTKHISIEKNKIPLIIILTSLFIISLIFVIVKLSAALIAFACIFTLIVAIALINTDKISKTLYKILSIVMILSLIINLNIVYTNTMMKHYSLRRAEFKKAAQWYKTNYKKNDKMLITETNIPKYYTGFTEDYFFSTKRLRSKDVESLISELNKNNITLIFIDQFYIDRLAVDDKNAIDKKAGLLKIIRDHYIDSKFFKLEKVFKTEESTGSYILRFQKKH